MKKYLFIIPMIMFLLFGTQTLNAATGDGYNFNIQVGYLDENENIQLFETVPTTLAFNLQYTLGNGQDYQVQGLTSFTEFDITTITFQISNGGADWQYLGAYDTENDTYLLNDPSTYDLIQQVDRNYRFVLVYKPTFTQYGIQYTQGFNDGYDTALDEVQVNLDQAYQEGYTQGQLDSESDVSAIATFIPQTMSVMAGFFFQIFGVEIMGISMLNVLAVFVTISVTFALFKVLIK